MNFKSVCSGLLAIGLTMGLVTGCGNTSGGGSASSGDKGEKPVVGVIQFAPHPSLDNCYEGFKQGLEEGGYPADTITIDFQNAQGDIGNSDLAAKTMVSKKYNLIAGIATPSAMSAYAATKDGNIPVVFTAVSDPLAAGIVKDLNKPATNATGTSDVLPLEQQVKMIRSFLPKAKKIGILYTTSEPNSASHLKKIKEIAPKYDFEIVDVGITNASEVAVGIQTLISKGVDCVNNFTDNNVVNNLSTVLKATDDAKIPVFGSEIEQVKNGCVAAQSIDYVALGKETGLMAAKILKGEVKPQELPVLEVKESTPVYNKQVMEKLGIVLPVDLDKAEAVTK